MSTGTRETLPRRRFLRSSLAGIGAAIAMPLFDKALDGNGEAMANGEPLPKIYLRWFFGNGWMSPRFVPQPGRGWQATPQLAPLAAAGLLPYVSIGHRFKMRWEGHGDVDKWWAHETTAVTMECCATKLTKSFDGTQRASLANGPSLTDVVAEHMPTSAPHRLVRCGISRNQTWTNRRTPLSYGEMDPAKLWDVLFSGQGQEATTERAKEQARALRARKMSVLDVVAEDARALKQTLGHADRARFEGHMTALRDVETRLQREMMLDDDLDPAQVCAPGSRPGGLPTYVENKEDLVSLNRDMSDVLVAAMACDLSRAFDVQFSKPAANTVFWQAGDSMGSHSRTHERDGDKQHRNIVFTMERLAYLLGRMKETPLGAGNLLDRTAGFVYSEVDGGANGDGHSRNGDLPFMIVGKAGGALAPGACVIDGGRRAVSRAHMTILRALDLDVASFGQEEMRTSEIIPEFVTG